MAKQLSRVTKAFLVLLSLLHYGLPVCGRNPQQIAGNQTDAKTLPGENGTRRASGKVWQAPAKWEDEIDERLTRAQIDYGPGDARVLKMMWQAVQLYQRAELFVKELDMLRELRAQLKKRSIPSLPTDSQLERLEGQLVYRLSPKEGNRYSEGEYFLIHCSNIKIEYLSSITVESRSDPPSKTYARATVSFSKLGRSKTFHILPSQVGMLQALPAVQSQSSPEGFFLEIVADQPRFPLYCRSIREFLPRVDYLDYKRAKPSSYQTQVAVVDLKTWLNQNCVNADDFTAKIERKADADWKRLLGYNFKPGLCAKRQASIKGGTSESLVGHLCQSCQRP